MEAYNPDLLAEQGSWQYCRLLWTLWLSSLEISTPIWRHVLYCGTLPLFRSNLDDRRWVCLQHSLCPSCWSVRCQSEDYMLTNTVVHHSCFQGWKPSAWHPFWMPGWSHIETSCGYPTQTALPETDGFHCTMLTTWFKALTVPSTPWWAWYSKTDVACFKVEVRPYIEISFVYRDYLKRYRKPGGVALLPSKLCTDYSSFCSSAQNLRL